MSCSMSVEWHTSTPPCWTPQDSLALKADCQERLPVDRMRPSRGRCTLRLASPPATALGSDRSLDEGQRMDTHQLRACCPTRALQRTGARGARPGR
jgi:hypothetical protein